MSNSDIYTRLAYLAENHLDDLYEVTMEAVNDNDAISSELQEANRRLQLAISRELMDEHQTKLAFRVTVKNIVKRHLKFQEEQMEAAKK